MTPEVMLESWPRAWSLAGGRPCSLPHLEAPLEQQKASFRALALEMCFGQEPTRLAFGALISLGEQVIRTSENFWGGYAENEPRHHHLQADVQKALRRVEARLNEAEAIRTHALRVATSPLIEAVADASFGPRPGVNRTPTETMWQIAIEILNDPYRAPERKHKWRIQLARQVQLELINRGLPQYKADSIAKNIRPSLNEWVKMHPE